VTVFYPILKKGGVSKKHLVKLPYVTFNENPFISFHELFRAYRAIFRRSAGLQTHIKINNDDSNRNRNSTTIFVHRFDSLHYKDNKLPWLIALDLSY
jgi:hypothetical protein